MMIVAKDNVTITVSGFAISCSNGEMYSLLNRVLVCNGRPVANNVNSIDEAVGIVCGFHGGRLF